MTEQLPVGESRGGEGRNPEGETTSILMSLIHELLGAGFNVGDLRIQRITEGQYSCQIAEHGEPPLETIYVGTDEVSNV